MSFLVCYVKRPGLLNGEAEAERARGGSIFRLTCLICLADGASPLPVSMGLQGPAIRPGDLARVSAGGPRRVSRSCASMPQNTTSLAGAVHGL